MTQRDFSLPEPDAPRSEVDAWLHGWLDRHIPSEWVRLLHDQDRAIALTFIEEYKHSVETFEVGYTALAEAVDLVNFVPKDSWPDHRSAQYLLIAENVKSFRSAQDRLMRGYYQDCGAIIRSLYEVFVRVLFMSLHSDHWSSAITYRNISGQRKFNVTGLTERRTTARLGPDIQATVCCRSFQHIVCSSGGCHAIYDGREGKETRVQE